MTDPYETPPDRWLQDLVTHADMWIGVACFVGALVYAVPDRVDQGVTFFACLIAIAALNWRSLAVIASLTGIATSTGTLLALGYTTFPAMAFAACMAAGTWLVVLGFLTGIIDKTNRSKGFDPITGGASEPEPVPETTTAAGVSMDLLILGGTFLIEVVLVFLGMYFEGWLQILFGFIGLVFLVNALMRALNDKALRRSIMDKAIAAAMAMPRTQLSIIARSQVAKESADDGASKRRRMMILTVMDFSLATICFVGCLAIHADHDLAPYVVFVALVSGGLWMIFLGKATGHGDPGHLEPHGLAYDIKPARSIAEVLAEVQKEIDAKGAVI